MERKAVSAVVSILLLTSMLTLAFNIQPERARAGSTVRDVAVTNITPSQTVVWQDYSMPINVTVENQGDLQETFNVDLYANTTYIATQTITLTNGTSTTITFIWSTPGFATGNYTISAYAWPVPGETDIIDNTFIGGTVFVTLRCDVNSDLGVDGRDIAIVARAYGTKPGNLRWNPAADVTGDYKIDGKDIARTVKSFGWRA